MADGFDFGDVAFSLFGGGGDSGPAFSSGLNLGAPSVQTELPSLPGGGDFGGALPALSESGGGGFGGIAKSIGDLGGLAKSALPFAQLGSAGLGMGLGIKGAQQAAEQTKIAKGAEKRQERIAGKAEEMAQPLDAFSRQQLGQAQQGKVDPAIEQQIQLWANGWKQKAMDFAARSGQGDSEHLNALIAWIDQQAEAMRVQAIQGEEQTGLAAASTAGGLLGQGAGAAGAAGGAAQQQQGGLASLIEAANKALATVTSGAA